MKCYACDSGNTETLATATAPFLTERVFDGVEQNVSLIHCKSCGYAWYEPRLTEEEQQKLYRNYRDDAYAAQRFALEPWYTPQINELLGKNDVYVQSRQRNLTEILQKFGKTRADRVLDYGGDKGQHIPFLFKDAEKFVFDISQTPPVPGVTAFSELDRVFERKYDFIMCCHLLEHVNDPLHILKIISELAERGAKIYIELPFDSPFYKNPLDNLRFLFNPNFPLKTLVRAFIEKLKDRRPKTMHEHINFFTADSARAMIEKAGFKILLCEKRKLDDDCFGKSAVISVLCEKS